MPQPPSGTVTFLFTDIEGSTRAWESSPAEMQVALRRHDALLRCAIESVDGLVFKTVGDAFCAVFGDGGSGVVAAAEAQRALATELWPDVTPIRVRMALHTGECEERDGDYFGPTVNRVARLLAIGWGGQTLVSGATAQIVGDRLPAWARLRDLGEHRLKDLGRPEWVFQLEVEGLETSFPAVRSFGNQRLLHNLPEQVTSFVGRLRELGEVRGLLSGPARLVTLTGPGGTGKTRLALEAAAELADGLGDGVWFVPLVAISGGEFLAGAVASVLGVSEVPNRAIPDVVVDVLKDKSLLLVLDNCEHVVEEAARFVDRLLRSCRGIRVFATSREPLGVDGEVIVQVPPLRLPEPDADPSGLLDVEAVHLLVERARLSRRDFALNASNAEAVARLCRRLDGIPLAIELAAARLRSLTIDELDTHLDERFALLTGGPRTAHQRHQTLRATVDWSYQLLTRDERQLFARLSVFAGGFDRDAAQAVAAGMTVTSFDVLDLLSRLADKNLIVRDDSSGTTRYAILETLRTYAADRLADNGTTTDEDVRREHALHYLTLAEQLAPILNSEQQLSALDRLDLDVDNLRAALTTFRSAGGAEMLRVVAALEWYWLLRSQFSEGSEWLFAAPVDDPALPPDLRAAALIATAFLRAFAADMDGTVSAMERVNALAPACDSPERLYGLASTFIAFTKLDDAASARPLAQAALARLETHGEPWEAGIAVTILGEIERAAGDVPLARDLYHRARRLFAEGGSRFWLSVTDLNLGECAVQLNAYEDAMPAFEQSIIAARALGNEFFAAMCSIGIASSACGLGDYRNAAVLLGAASNWFDERKVQIQPLEQAMADEAHAVLERVLSPSDVEQLMALGRSMSPDDAIERSKAEETRR